MPNVARFTLPSARDLSVPGAGTFIAGVLDVDANNVKLLTRTRYLVKPYGAIEVGIVDSATPLPTLPAVPGPPAPDPYPQYPTMDEIIASVELRAAFAASETGAVADGAVAAIVGTGGTATRGELDALFVAGRVLDSDGTPIPTKKLTVKLTADGLDIDDLIVEDVA